MHDFVHCLMIVILSLGRNLCIRVKFTEKDSAGQALDAADLAYVV